MQLKTPKSLHDDHEALLSELNQIASLNTDVSKNAKNVANAFRSHFNREERTVLPQLSLLMAIAEGNWDIDTREALLKNNILLNEFHDLKKRTSRIFAAAEEMIKVAENEHNKEAKKIAESIMLHIQVEEEVSYPAIIMISKYLKKHGK